MLVAVAERQGESFYIDGHDRRRVNTSQAATIAGVHLNTIYNWIRDNKVEYVRTASGQLRIYVDTLIRPDTRYR